MPSSPLDSPLTRQGHHIHSSGDDISRVADMRNLRCSRHHHDWSIIAPQLAAVALRLAQSWGDATAVRTAPVRQQAYLSAALVEAIGRLGVGPLENHPGLLPALLAGVSTRLESPLPPIRYNLAHQRTGWSALAPSARQGLYRRFHSSLGTLHSRLAMSNVSGVQVDRRKTVDAIKCIQLSSPRRPESRVQLTATFASPGARGCGWERHSPPRWTRLDLRCSATSPRWICCRKRSGTRPPRRRSRLAAGCARSHVAGATLGHLAHPPQQSLRLLIMHEAAAADQTVAVQLCGAMDLLSALSTCASSPLAHKTWSCAVLQDKEHANGKAEQASTVAAEGVETGTDSDDDSLEAYGLSEGEDEGALRAWPGVLAKQDTHRCGLESGRGMSEAADGCVCVCLVKTWRSEASIRADFWNECCGDR